MEDRGSRIEDRGSRSSAGVGTIADHAPAHPGATWEPSLLALKDVVEQLEGYFCGMLSRFDVPLDPAGSAFQLQVWRELLRIPYGETRTYGDVARAIGQPRAARAVGLANHENPIAIVIPCHRVIGSGGRLVGYGGGLPRKRRLLDLEARFAAPVGRTRELFEEPVSRPARRAAR